MTAVIIAVLITWIIMGVLYFVIDDTDSEIAKYIIAAPVIVILVWPVKTIKKILFVHIKNNYDSYDIFGHTTYIKKRFAAQIGIPSELKLKSGKDLKYAPRKADLVKSYDDFKRLGFSKECIDGLKERKN